MHDAALAAIEDGRYEDAAKVVASSLERERDTIRSSATSPSRSSRSSSATRGSRRPCRRSATRSRQSQRIRVAVDVAAGERLAEKAQVELYQIIRESLNQAVHRRPKEIEVTVGEVDGGGSASRSPTTASRSGDAASIEDIEERVRVLNARLSSTSGEDGGTRDRRRHARLRGRGHGVRSGPHGRQASSLRHEADRLRAGRAGRRPPATGSTIELEDAGRFEVVKVASSPLPRTTAPAPTSNPPPSPDPGSSAARRPRTSAAASPLE